MALGGVVATQLNPLTTPKYQILVGGLDVRPYVPIEGVRVTEAGPGTVSQASFTIEDTTGAVPIPADGAEVQIWDLTLGYLIFFGWVNDYKADVIGLGRNIRLNAFGVESLLDWFVAPATALSTFTNPSGTYLMAPVLTSIMANGSFPGIGLYAPETNALDASLRDGNATWPLGSTARLASLPVFVTAPLTTFPSGSFRKWLAQIGKYNERETPPVTIPLYFTVDFYRRLRLWEQGRVPADYANLTVTDTPGGALVASNLVYERHPGDIVRTIYVNGGNAAGSGYVNDGSGIVGRQEVVDDATSTTAQAKADIATAYFATQYALIRGSFDLEDYSPPNGNVHPGCTVTLTDSQVSLSAQVYGIDSIDKVFHGSLQTWTVHFGGRPPSVAELLRKQYAKQTSWPSAA